MSVLVQSVTVLVQAVLGRIHLEVAHRDHTQVDHQAAVHIHPAQVAPPIQEHQVATQVARLVVRLLTELLLHQQLMCTEQPQRQAALMVIRTAQVAQPVWIPQLVFSASAAEDSRERVACQLRNAKTDLDLTTQAASTLTRTRLIS